MNHTEIDKIYFDATHLECTVFIDLECEDETHNILISDTYELQCSWDYSHCEKGEEDIEGTDMVITDVYVWVGGNYEGSIDRFLLSADNPVLKRLINDEVLAEYITSMVAQQAGNIAAELLAEEADWAYDAYKDRMIEEAND